MPNGFYRDVIKELQSLGYAQGKGGKGSHKKWLKAGKLLITVPFNLTSRHTANSIMKDAGSAKKF